MDLLYGALVAGSPLVGIEIISRLMKIPAELSRKLTHVFSALVVCLLPTLVSLRQVSVIGLAFFALLVVTRYGHVWKSLYGVKRTSYGEVLFPLGVGAAGLLANDNTIFVVCILVMGLSDTAAALIGQRYGKSTKFLPFKKSFVGSVSFFVCTITLFLLLSKAAILPLIVVALFVTVVELLSPYGSDNLSVPVACAVMLSLIT